MARVVLITGSTSGMGLKMAHKFAKEGYEVILNGFGTENEINNIKAELHALNGKDPLYVGADLNKMEEVDMMVDEILKTYPAGVDVLINNAGVLKVGDSQRATMEELDLELNVIVKAPFLLCKRLIPFMKSKAKGSPHGGRIINTASIAGLGCMHSGDCAAYVTAKHALVGLSKSIAAEVIKDNITCNVICPGATETPLMRGAFKDFSEINKTTLESIEAGWKQIQPGGFVEPEKIAELAWFLSSSDAKYITGSSLVMDSGFML